MYNFVCMNIQWHSCSYKLFYVFCLQIVVLASTFLLCICLHLSMFVEYSHFLLSSPRWTTAKKKISLPPAPTGPTTGRRDDGVASTSSLCPRVPQGPGTYPWATPATATTSAPSTAPAAQRAKALTGTTRTAGAPPPPPPPQTSRRPAGAPPAAPPQTRRPPWTPPSVDPHPPGTAVEDLPAWSWRPRAASRTNRPGRRAAVCWRRWRSWGWGGHRAASLLLRVAGVAGVRAGTSSAGPSWSSRWTGCTVQPGENHETRNGCFQNDQRLWFSSRRPFNRVSKGWMLRSPQL